ncbi:PRC-barrel domain-containing protein [Pararhizobium mangrovi]|uniref:PRC-barrel domain-containing protein n=1 Tax=Pararhizobium mangrovi TaxID=2590452 RepID=UPI001F1732F2|nr:PRC-barrel domain-containing protein [Pararhizobium mangrovi]
MKTTLMRSVAASALLVGASLAVPSMGYVATAAAQSNDSQQNGSSGDQMQKQDQSGSGSGSMNSDSNSSTSGSMNSDSDSGSTSGSMNSSNSDQSSSDSSASDDSSKSGDASAMTQQKQDQVLASSYIGQSVYNGNDKSIGDISDLVFTKDGGIKAAVIGVGGFLGIGQKNVAVAFNRINIQRQSDGASVKLVTDMTEDQLKNAPEFKKLQAQSNNNGGNGMTNGNTNGGATGMGTGGANGGATGGATGTGSGNSAQ